MFGKSKSNVADNNQEPLVIWNDEGKLEPLSDEDRHALLIRSERQHVEDSAVASLALPAAPEGNSCIDSGLSFFGKIVGQGKLAIFGRVEGEVHASTVLIGEGAQVQGDIVAEELTIGGHVNGTIHANHVKLNSTAVVEGDIYHQSLAIEENAQFEGTCRRQENAIDPPSLVPAKCSSPQSINVNGQGGSALNGLNPSQAGNGPVNNASDFLNS
jgi:cytoskeletal protein CcmA (bactofilin family)